MNETARIAAVKERLRSAQTAGHLARSAAPACHQCIYGPINETGKGWCEHPVFYRIRYDPVSGKLFGGHNRMNTTQARSDEGLCGPQGLLFEGYTWWRRPFRWISTAVESMARALR